MKKKIVFVGLSGGVDSAVSAAMLSQQGYEIVGVFIKTWHPEFLVCNEEEERMDAMRVAAYLNIPFLTFDFKDVYKKEVADYMIREYKAGRTPNPDVMCNKEVKFGAFLKKALSMGADFVATGHYAQNKKVTVVGIPQGGSPTSGVEKTDYLFEGDFNTLILSLAEKITRMQIYQMFLESNASEQSSRMMAMKNASEASGEMIDDLTLMFNKARQANITREISEISAGMASVG